MPAESDIEAGSYGEAVSGDRRTVMDTEKADSNSSASPEGVPRYRDRRPANIDINKDKEDELDDFQDNQLSPEMEEFDPDEHMRTMNESEENITPHYTWWFASTAIPLLAATIGPMANVTSIAALVSPWRDELLTDGDNAFDPRYGSGVPDPKWYNHCK